MKKIKGSIDYDSQELGDMLDNIDFTKYVNEDEIYDNSIKKFKVKEGKKMIKNKYKKLTAVAASLLIVCTVLAKPTLAQELMRKILNQTEMGNVTYNQFDEGGAELSKSFKGKVFDKDGNEVTATHPNDRNEKLYTKDGKEIYKMVHGDIITMDEKDDYVIEVTDISKINDYISFTVNMPEYIPDGYEFTKAVSEKYALTDTKDDIDSIVMEFKDNYDNTIQLGESYIGDESASIMTTESSERITVNGFDGVLMESGIILWNQNGICYYLAGVSLDKAEKGEFETNVDKDELMKIAESIK